MDALVIGRHATIASGVDAVEERAVTFPLTGKECIPVVLGLMAEAQERGLALVLQNTPGQVTAALLAIQAERYRREIAAIAGCAPEEEPVCEVWVIISVPGERRAGAVKAFDLFDPEAAKTAAQAVAFANPRAKVEASGNEINITVDPPSAFVFSHLEPLL